MISEFRVARIHPSSWRVINIFWQRNTLREKGERLDRYRLAACADQSDANALKTGGPGAAS
jgi:hypothetical protein